MHDQEKVHLTGLSATTSADPPQGVGHSEKCELDLLSLDVERGHTLAVIKAFKPSTLISCRGRRRGR